MNSAIPKFSNKLINKNLNDSTSTDVAIADTYKDFFTFLNFITLAAK